MNDIERVIKDDPIWPNICLRQSESNSSCADFISVQEPEKSKLSIASLLPGLKLGFGTEPVEDYT